MILHNLRGENIQMDFQKLTQIVNIDMKLSNDIYLYIKNYFSSKKFSEDELLLYGGEIPLIKIGELEVSRSKYICLPIASIEDIDDLLIHKKDSILMKYNKHHLESLDIQIEIDELERQFLTIINKLRKSLPDKEIIEISDIQLNAEILLNKNITPYISMKYSYYEKLIQLIHILIFNQCINGDNYILYLHNIDTYLNIDEARDVIKLCENSSNINIIVSFTNTKYMDINKLEYVNFIYEGSIRYIPNIELMLDKLNNYNLSLRYYDIDEFSKFVYNNAKSFITNEFEITRYYEDIYNTIVSRVVREDKGIQKLENCLIF